MTTAQQTTMKALEAEWGESFVVLEETGEDIIVGIKGQHAYYEPNPVRYIVSAHGDADELDRDGFRMNA